MAPTWARQQFGPDIARRAPELLEDAVGDMVELQGERHGEFVRPTIFAVTCGGVVLLLAMNAVEFVLDRPGPPGLLSTPPASLV